MRIEGLSLNLATVRQQWNLSEAVEACARHGLAGVAPWRDQVIATGPAEAARIFKANGMRVTGYCRGGLFPAADATGRQAAIDDNKRDIETCSIQVDYGEPWPLPLVQPTYWSSLTGPIERQWDERIVGAPLHPGAARYYREKGYIE